jgi:hypothetical protein
MFFSTVFVAAILGGVATLAVLSALTLAPLDRSGRRSIVPFVGVPFIPVASVVFV